MTGRELNEACMEAALECPQTEAWTFDGREIVGGEAVRVCTLHCKGAAAVVKYWRNTNTIGGRLLWKKGYWECLPDEAIATFSTLETAVGEFIEEHMKGGMTCSR